MYTYLERRCDERRVRRVECEKMFVWREISILFYFI